VDRCSFIGGSDARIIMGDDAPALLRLWQEKRGEVEPEDLSDDLLVQLGTATETLPAFERTAAELETRIAFLLAAIDHPTSAEEAPEHA